MITLKLQGPLVLAVLLAPVFTACRSHDNNLGVDGHDGGAHDGPVTCQQAGKSYRPGDSVPLSACATCVCQADGTIGLCTGACPPDARADTAVTCQQGGQSYRVGETITLSACATCVCQADGTLGMCTGECPADSGTSDPAKLCTSTGGQVSTTPCSCKNTEDFPSSCSMGACSCPPGDSHTISLCTCPTGACFDPALGCKLATQP